MTRQPSGWGAQPLVNMLDGAGDATEHGTIFGLHYTRLQGGANAIILDPQVDDIGWAAVYLCSPAAKFLTGVVLPVDGGVSIGF